MNITSGFEFLKNVLRVSGMGEREIIDVFLPDDVYKRLVFHLHSIARNPPTSTGFDGGIELLGTFRIKHEAVLKGLTNDALKCQELRKQNIKLLNMLAPEDE